MAAQRTAVYLERSNNITMAATQAKVGEGDRHSVAHITAAAVSDHDSIIREFVKDDLHPSSLSSYKFIGLRKYEFVSKEERGFISLELENGEGFLTLAEWLDPKHAEKRNKVKGGNDPFIGKPAVVSKFNICVQIDNIGWHQDQRAAKTPVILGQKGTDLIKLWWDEHCIRAKDEFNPYRLGTVGRCFEDVYLIGFAPSKAGGCVYSCILAYKAQTSDEPGRAHVNSPSLGYGTHQTRPDLYASARNLSLPDSQMGGDQHGTGHAASHATYTPQDGLWSETTNYTYGGNPQSVPPELAAANVCGSMGYVPSQSQPRVVGGQYANRSHTAPANWTVPGVPSSGPTNLVYEAGSSQNPYHHNFAYTGHISSHNVAAQRGDSTSTESGSCSSGTYYKRHGSSSSAHAFQTGWVNSVLNDEPQTTPFSPIDGDAFHEKLNSGAMQYSGSSNDHNRDDVYMN